MGNHAFQTEGVKHLTCIPEITFFSFEHIKSLDSYLMIASDGLWHYVNSQQAVDVLRSRLKESQDLTHVAKEIVAACYHAGGEKFGDDTTLIILPL